MISKSSYTEALHAIKEIYTSLLPAYTYEMDCPTIDILVADKILLKTLDLHVYIYQQRNNPNATIKDYEAAFMVNSKLKIAYPL